MDHENVVSCRFVRNHHLLCVNPPNAEALSPLPDIYIFVADSAYSIDYI